MDERDQDRVPFGGGGSGTVPHPVRRAGYLNTIRA